ncbi:shikimate dehydrogenase [Thermocladium modestius]|uniref:Shikimate dehydrogenase (NADP(+)) n=1 Tax=Thermocladium modestius TaxID=62609 RepID=A0A830GRB3_9CREN|nr:shikimate dehydrogenase [Thermocladium modestius]GGP18900.1 shikimate dehydrogenase [Thermocladium modestius]
MLVHALMGNPVSSSLSPAIHNFIYSRLGLEAFYVPLQVSPKRLMHAVEVAREALNGFNVTIPYKAAVIDYLDSVDEEAKLIGAVNAVAVRNGEAVGHNTDAPAIAELIDERGIKCGSALIIGAGGAARAALFALRGRCSSVVVADRSRERGEAMEALARSLGIAVEAIGFAERGSAAARVDLVINATPLGMYVDEDPLDPSALAVGGPAVIDLAYAREGTRLSRAARAAGLPVVDGLDVLIRQAIKSEELWLGRGLVGVADEDIRRAVVGGGGR